MDPNVTLAEIRAALADYLSAGVRRSAKVDAADTLVDLVEALDQWLTRGGFLPSAWAPGSYVLATDPDDQGADVDWSAVTDQDTDQGTRCGGCGDPIRPGAIGGTWIGPGASSYCPNGAELIVGCPMHYPARDTA